MPALQTIIGTGTLVNVIAVLVGAGAGLLIGSRLSERTRTTVTDALGLITLVVAAQSIAAIGSSALAAAVPHRAAFTVILVALLIGAVVGSALKVEERIAQLGDWARRVLPARGGDDRFVDGFVTSTLVFCVGPLAILGSLSDGLGRGAEQLYVKSVLDGFAAMAFASALGRGVLLAAGSVAIYQGAFTALGWGLGRSLPTAEIDALTVTGGIVLLGLGIRLIGLKQIRVADLLPALVFAPLFVALAQLI